MFAGQAFDINFAHAGQIGPWARPQIARNTEYESIDSVNPERHIETDAIPKQKDIKMAGEENIRSKYAAPNICTNEYGSKKLKNIKRL